MISHELQCHFNIETWERMIPKDHISRDVVKFVDDKFDKLDIREKKFNGSSSYSVRSMLKVLVYAAVEGNVDVREIEDDLQFNIVYKYLSGDKTPSASVINNFQREYADVIDTLNKLLLKEFKDEGLTNFDNEATDGSYSKANNNRFNVINEKDLKTLIKYYERGKITDKEVEKLKRPAYNLYKNEPHDVKERLEKLKELKIELEKSGQNTIPINDCDSRWMTNKKGVPEPSYCIQYAADNEAKIITAIVVTNEITDHKTFPIIAEKCMENIGKKPAVFTADTAYHNITTFDYAEKNQLLVLTPSYKETRRKKKKLNPKPYHKDHFQHDLDKDVFICPEGKELPLKYEYPEYDENDQLIKNRRIYKGQTCHNCPHQKECTPSTKQRTITENVTKYEIEIMKKLEQEEYINLRKTRSSTVEPVIGAMKANNLDNLQITGKKRLQETLDILMLGYNLKRKHRILKEKNKNQNNDKQTKLTT